MSRTKTARPSDAAVTCQPAARRVRVAVAGAGRNLLAWPPVEGRPGVDRIDLSVLTDGFVCGAEPAWAAAVLAGVGVAFAWAADRAAARKSAFLAAVATAHGIPCVVARAAGVPVYLLEPAAGFARQLVESRAGHPLEGEFRDPGQAFAALVVPHLDRLAGGCRA